VEFILLLTRLISIDLTFSKHFNQIKNRKRNKTAKKMRRRNIWNLVVCWREKLWYICARRTVSLKSPGTRGLWGLQKQMRLLHPLQENNSQMPT